MFGHCTKISYQEIADALRTKNIKVTMTSFKVPKSRGYIAFHYEVGERRRRNGFWRVIGFYVRKWRLSVSGKKNLSRN